MNEITARPDLVNKNFTSPRPVNETITSHLVSNTFKVPPSTIKTPNPLSKPQTSSQIPLVHTKSSFTRSKSSKHRSVRHTSIVPEQCIAPQDLDISPDPEVQSGTRLQRAPAAVRADDSPNLSYHSSSLDLHQFTRASPSSREPLNSHQSQQHRHKSHTNGFKPKQRIHPNSSHVTPTQIIAQVPPNIMATNNSFKGQQSVLAQNNVLQNKVVGKSTKRDEQKRFIPPHLRGLADYDPKVRRGDTVNEIAKSSSLASSEDPNFNSHNAEHSVTSSTQPDHTSLGLNTLPTGTSVLSSSSAKGKNIKPVISYADSVKAPLNHQTQPTVKQPALSPKSQVDNIHPVPISILKRDSQDSIGPARVLPHLRGLDKPTTANTENVHVRFDEPCHPTNDKSDGKKLPAEKAQTQRVDALVQQLASEEAPLQTPALSGNGGFKNGKSRNQSVLSNMNEEGAKSTEIQTDFTVKKDKYGFEITTKLEYELAGWDGNWAPAPVEWDARPAFNNNDARHIRFIENWTNDRVIEALKSPRTLDTTTELYSSGNGPSSGLSNFLWEPYPVDWTCHRSDDPFTNTPEHIDQNAFDAQKAFCEVYFPEKKKRRAEAKEAQEFNRQMWLEAMTPKYPNKQSPKANIYVRPAQPADVPQITAIYNYYVKNSPLTQELEEVDQDKWRGRHRLADEERLPFMVAVLRNSKGAKGRGGASGRGRNGRRDNIYRGPIPETIVGFVVAEDHCGRYTAYGHLAELSLFVHPQHQHLGIGKTLLDRIMPALDPVAVSKNGTEFINDGFQNYELGGVRDIHKILISIGYFPGDRHAMEWQRDWLMKDWDFEHVGTLPGIGFKNGKK